MLAVTKTRIAASVLVASLATAPAAAARPADAITPPLTHGGSAPPASVAAPTVVSRDGNTFDWGDAGLGAAGTLSLIALGAGIAGLGRRQRRAGVRA